MSGLKKMMLCWFPPLAFLLSVGSMDAIGDQGPTLLWDTVKHSDQALSPDAVAKMDGWKQVAGENVGIAGDACMTNSSLALVLRKGSRGAEWYYRLGDKMVKGPNLVPVGVNGDKARTIDGFKVIDSTPETALLEASVTSESGKKMGARYFLKKDKPFVETQPGEGTESILVETRAKYAVLPDLFGADLVVNAQDVQSPELRFPSENMLVELAEDGNAIVMVVWRSREQKVRMTLDGAGDARAISAAEIVYKKDKDMNVWVSVLAAPKIWCQKKMGELDAVKDTKLEWKIPYPALWRTDYRREDGLIDSWKFIIRKGKDEWDGFGVSAKKDGTVWHPTRATFGYPARIEGDSACLRNTKYEGLKNLKYTADAAAIIYPFQKIGASPKTVYGVMDVLREALEEAPEFTRPDDMQVKRFPKDRYPGVCYTTGECEKIFDAKEEKAKKKEIVERLRKMNFFIVTVRARIEEYMSWWKKTHEWAGREKAAKPQIAGLIDEMDGLIARFDKEYAQMKLDERTPAKAHGFTEGFIALIDSNEDKKDEKAKQLGRDTRTIGGTQDHAVGVFRMITKEARQRAGYRMLEAKDDASFDFAKEFRRRTQEVLQNTLGVEGGFTD